MQTPADRTKWHQPIEFGTTPCHENWIEGMIGQMLLSTFLLIFFSIDHCTSIQISQEFTRIGSDNDLVPKKCQAIILTKDGFV